MQIVSKIIASNGFFPNNQKLPLLLYKNVLIDPEPNAIKSLFSKNTWVKSWLDSIYTFHHYHSNTHEVLGISDGKTDVEIGGPNGAVFELQKGDVLIIPAGVSHKNLKSMSDIKVVGAYSLNIEYDMKYGKKEEEPIALDRIKKVPLPMADPVFGKEGALFKYWF